MEGSEPGPGWCAAGGVRETPAGSRWGERILRAGWQGPLEAGESTDTITVTTAGCSADTVGGTLAAAGGRHAVRGITTGTTSGSSSGVSAANIMLVTHWIAGAARVPSTSKLRGCQYG